MTKVVRKTTAKYTVAEVEERSGVKASSLRQWERRYGFPRPERSASGYRYYSEQDLSMIRRMSELIAQGIPPSRAAAIMQEEPLAGTGGRATGELARELGDALRTLDLERADRTLSEAFVIHSVEGVLLDVMRPALIHIGELWHEGKINVATEHVASNHLQGRLRSLLRMMPTEGGRHRLLVACAPGEQHEIGTLMLTTLLRRAGFEAVYLGADTPIADLVAMARSMRPAAVLVSATTKASVKALQQGSAELKVAAPLILFGGQAFNDHPDLATELGGTYMGNDLRTVVPALTAQLSDSRAADRTKVE